MSYDHYQKAKELILMLENAGFKDQGELLQRAIDEGATGTEIFMALRWNISQIMTSSLINDFIKNKAGELLNELDKALH